MSVADILQQMAENAGRARAQRGSIIGTTIGALAQIPGQVMDERTRMALQQQQQARLNEQAGYARNADARAAKDQAMQDAASAAALKRKAVVDAGLAAAIGDSGDPAQFDATAAYKAVVDAGDPSAISEVIARHRELAPKLTEFDPTKGLQDPTTGKVIREPAAKVMTPAEQAQRDETARHNRELEKNAALTTGRTDAAQKETERHNRATEAATRATAAAAAAGGVSVDLDKMPPDQRAQAQALVDGRRTLDARLASKPYGQAIINAAYQIDPTFDQGNYNARAKARTDLTSPNGTGGKTIGALNTAIQHAGKLSDLIEKLDNFETPLANAIVNPIRTGFGSTKVTNYDTVAPQLAKEIERVWRGAGGTAGEIHDLIETIGHNKGKQQQREALQQFVELAKGKLDTQEQQRDTILGEAGKSIPILYESNKAIVDQIATRAGVKPAAAAPSGAPAEGQAGSVNGTPAVWKTVNGTSGWYAK